MRIIEAEQGSLAWKKSRLGVITGTRLKAVLGNRKAQLTLISELIAEVETEMPKNINVTQVMERGIAEEDFAVIKYEKLTGEKTEVIGFCLHEKIDWLGLSPDRFIKKDGKYKKGVEVKSPNSDTVIKYKMEQIDNPGIITPEYKPQIIQYFIVNEDCEELDFVVYDERFINEDMKLLIVTVTRKELEADIAKAMTKIDAFRTLWLSYSNDLLNNNF